MAYFNELPNIEYLSRNVNQSSNEDYTLVKNIFRRAKLREDIANAVTAFQYYQIKDDERPEQIAERIYGDHELDWVVLITNNIINYNAQWPLSNDSLYEYLLDKYNSEDVFDDIKYLQTVEVRDEYNRLVVPGKLQVDADISQKFTTTNSLLYDLKTFPVPNDYYPLKIDVNLGQFLEIWERDNQGEGEAYTGVEYQITEIRLEQQEEPTPFLYPPYSRLDYSNLFVYGRTEIKKVFVLNTLQDWPSTWGGVLAVYNQDSTTSDITLKSNIGEPINIANDSRLYKIVAKEDEITNTKLPQFKFNSTNTPFPGLTVTIFNETEISYLNTTGEVVKVRGQQEGVTNYEYEVELNENTRKILLLKPEYLGVFIGDMKSIMSYDTSSEKIDSRTKRVYNSKIL